MNKSLVKSIGSIGQDNLITKLSPAAECFGITLKKLDIAGTIKRGTLLARDADGNYFIYGGAGAIPSAILADDVEVGTVDNETAVAYRCGNFNPAAVIVAENYKMTADDIDILRKYDIIFTQMI